jgi:Protein of unknown function (DUF3489)
MSDTEIENAKVSDAQPGPKDRQTERRSLNAKAKSRQSKRSSTRPRAKSRDASRSKKQGQAAKGSTKQDLVIQMLGRQSGVSIEQIVAKTDWQPHSVRGFFSGVVRKKLGLPLASEVGKDGVRRYHIAPSASSKT